MMIHTLNKLFTSMYKIIGFAALVAILTGLLSYFVIHAFYLFSDSWITPVILSPSHERVTKLNIELAQQTHQRDRLIAEQRQLTTELGQVRRAAAMQKTLQREMMASLQHELALAQAKAKHLRAARNQAHHLGKALIPRGDELAKSKQDRLQGDRRANLITRETLAAEHYALARVAHTKQTILDHRDTVAMELRVVEERITSIEAAMAAIADSRPLPARNGVAYDVLLMLEKYEQIRLEAVNAAEIAADLQQQIATIDTAIQRYERILAQIHDSPYLRAMAQQITIAFVPYENLDEARVGSNVYHCALGLVWCHSAGTIVEVLDGEVASQHPLSHAPLRGLMVEVAFDATETAQEPVLFASGKPLWPF